jgi:hypothetical protein
LPYFNGASIVSVLRSETCRIERGSLAPRPEEGREKQPTGFSSSHAKMARTKDDDDDEKEDWEMTLNRYGEKSLNGGRANFSLAAFPLRASRCKLCT